MRKKQRTAEQARVWHELGIEDPDWAVESRQDKKHGGWSDSLDQFYATGRARVSEAYELSPTLKFDAALDYGSGTGRLSFALAEDFETVTCVDVSSSMLETLVNRARERGVNNIRPIELAGFQPVADHDFAISLITLQHLPDRDAVAHAIHLMVSALRPGGLLLVEMPVRPHNLRYRVQPRLQVFRALRRLGFRPATLHRAGLSGISMMCAPREWMVATIENSGARVTSTVERRGSSHQQMYYCAIRI